MKQFHLFHLFVALVIASEVAKPSWQHFILNTPIDDLIHLPLTLTKHKIRAIKVQEIVSQLRTIQPCNDLHENNQIWADSDDDSALNESSALMLLSFLQSKPLNTMKMVFMSVDVTIVSCVPSHFLTCLYQPFVLAKVSNQDISTLKDTYLAIKECCIPSDEYSSSSATDIDTKSLSSSSLMKKLMRSIRYTFPHHIVVVQRNDEASSCSKMMSFSMGMGSSESEKSSENSEHIDVKTLLSSPSSTSSSSPHEAIPETEVVGTKREVIVYFLALNPPDKPHLYNGENVRLRSSDIGSVIVVTDS